MPNQKTSPPSRGAWIEIHITCALFVVVKSPPSRGAWIEIMGAWFFVAFMIVAPLAGGVD